MGHMASHVIRQLIALIISVAFLAGTNLCRAVDSSYYLAGLGLHQETSRDIYLGGIYLPGDTSRPENFELMSDPRVMEYRIVARRTSIRSLLGGMLLQSEVATGEAPSEATTEFADNILSQVKSSLYAGDSLEISLNSSGETSVFLNGHALTKIEDTEVANYLLAGWVSENGPSTTFRDALMTAEINPGLLALRQANLYSSEREDEVASWITRRDEAAIAVATATGAAALPEDGTQNGALVAQSVAFDGEVAELQLEEAILADVTEPAAATQLVLQPGDIEMNLDAIPRDGETLQLAALLPTAGNLHSVFIDPEVLSLGVQEYSQRLSEFHGGLVAMVYSKIRYPNRAIRRNLQGRLELDVTLRESGELVAVSIAQSSGQKMLDAAAVKAAEDALSSGALSSIDAVAKAEFGSEVDRITVPVPVLFKLTE